MNLEQIIAEILKLSATDVVAGLKDKAKAIYQAIFDEGHGVATQQYQTEKKNLENRATKAEGDLAKANDRIKKLSEENPDVAKLHSSYGEEIKGLKEQIDTLKSQSSTQATGLRVDLAATRLEVALVEAGVIQDYAEILAQKPEVRERMSPDEKGTIRVMQPDKAIPYAGTEREQIRAFAADLKKGVKPIFLASTVERGTGTDQVNGGTPNSDKALFDGIRKEVTEKQGVANTTANRETLHKRLGMTA